MQLSQFGTKPKGENPKGENPNGEKPNGEKPKAPKGAKENVVVTDAEAGEDPEDPLALSART